MPNVTENLAAPSALLGVYLSGNLPSAALYPVGTPANTADLGILYSNGATWQSTPIVFANQSNINTFAPLTYLRPPAVTDNAALGYTTSSVWQYGGTLYNAATYCAADSAAWQPGYLSTGGGPVDVMGTTVTKFAGGTVAMLKDFTGPAIIVAVTIGGVYQIFTINMLANGELDNVALGAVMAQADANTDVKVIQVYDQTGNGNHLTPVNAQGIPVFAASATVTTATTLTINSGQTGTIAAGMFAFGNGIPPGITIASGTGPYTLSSTGAPSNPAAIAVYFGNSSLPYIDWDPTFGRYLIYSSNEITNGGTTNKRALQWPQAMTITSAQALGVYAVGMGISSADGTNPVLCAVGDFGIGSAHTLSFQGSSLAGFSSWGQIVCYDSGGFARGAPVTIVNQPMVFTATTAAGSWTGFVNEKTGSGTSISAGALAGGYIFNASLGGVPYGAMKLAGIAIFNSAITAAQNTAMRRAAYTRFNIYPHVVNQLATLGDSRFTSTYVTPQFGNGDLLGKFLGRNWNILNIAVSGTTALQQIGDGLVPTVTGVARSLQTLKGPGLNYAVICVGINDFIVNNASPQQVLSYLQTYALQITAAGWIPILISELASTSTNPAVGLPILRSLINTQGAAGMNVAAIINLSGYVPVMTPANTAYYYDGIHPTLAVHTIIASAIAASLNTLTPQWVF